ncbi:MAG: DUF1854 domain-containing protein [Armatimonadetes bacterium]|nr:DUF1854 domain-containing protein [Armatimonadota bacterium]MDE2205046.1 DUF1854 domain-containing protein [Armatimonadota bacterium]
METQPTSAAVGPLDNQDEDTSAIDLRILQPQEVQLLRLAGETRLVLAGDRCYLRVTVARAFPLSDPDHYIGFLDGAGKDIGVLPEADHLDAESRKIVAEELERRYFVPVVLKVISVTEEHGALYWKVMTDRGEREVAVREVKDNLQEVSGGRLLMTDVDGNRFEFPNIHKLDNRSLGILMRYM